MLDVKKAAIGTSSGLVSPVLVKMLLEASGVKSPIVIFPASILSVLLMRSITKSNWALVSGWISAVLLSDFRLDAGVDDHKEKISEVLTIAYEPGITDEYSDVNIWIETEVGWASASFNQFIEELENGKAQFGGGFQVLIKEESPVKDEQLYHILDQIDIRNIRFSYAGQPKNLYLPVTNTRRMAPLVPAVIQQMKLMNPNSHAEIDAKVAEFKEKFRMWHESRNIPFAWGTVKDMS